jgi:hypothetical protein
MEMAADHTWTWEPPPYYEDYFLLRVEKCSLFLICGQAFSLEKNQGNALQGWIYRRD